MALPASPRAEHSRPPGVGVIESGAKGEGGAEGPQLVGFDIETDTSVGGLDPETAPIVAVALSTDAGDHVLTGPEAAILSDIDRLVAELPAGFLVTWNGSGFDLPFVARRAEILGVPLGLDHVDDPSRASRRDPGRRVVRGRWHRLVQLDGYLVYRADVGRAGIT
jgi:DNA polymerase elongation subunit (family B)